ncbi:MAG: hypothetical protein AB7O28_21755 [Vicinamibacterales bacterium]
MTSTRGAAVLALAFVAGLAASAPAQTAGYTAALAGVRGTYPGERVDSVYVFHTVDVAGGPMRASVTVPWIRMESTPAAGAASATVSGFGDPLLRADVRVVDRPYALQVSLAGAVKAPLVDAATGRGTGEVDVAGGINILTVVSRTSLMADVLAWKIGDPPDVDYTDAVSYSVGVAHTFGAGRWSALSSLSGSSAGIGDLSPPVALTIGALAVVGRRHSVVGSVSLGLTDGASDVSAGVSWRVAR